MNQGKASLVPAYRVREHNQTSQDHEKRKENNEQKKVQEADSSSEECDARRPERLQEEQHTCSRVSSDLVRRILNLTDRTGHPLDPSQSARIDPTRKRPRKKRQKRGYRPTMPDPQNTLKKTTSAVFAPQHAHYRGSPNYF